MDLIPQLRRAILAQSLPPPSQTLLTTLTSRSPPPPIPSLLATAKARLLASDLTNISGTVVDSSMPVFPPNIDSATVQESTISQNTHVQVLDIENLSLSRWEQVEELEAIERGERTRGRQVIRVTDEENGEADVSSSSAGQTQASRAGGAAASGGANAVHRLVLQDGRGKKVFAVELRRISGIGIGKTHIGEKILLRAGAVVARGTVLLTPETCTLLGGKIEAWHEAWMEGRLARLRESVGADRPQ
ncbi:RecQ-mediated genome instability protein 1 [Trichoderma lentiforme]|uniref:RecQ-mediated genome instability protein 1 n=1 Tax=Trichoderma lentiforme TaxID=1567552 RepID=A0A9P4X3U9_9HYPO|nr:RecQ-mediated genome instability protein 1 [Trichoderma lentiforme]